MPPPQLTLGGYVAGDTFTLNRPQVSAIPAGLTLAKAYFTVKAKVTDLDAAALLQLSITPTLSGSGQITDIGAGTGSLPVGTGALYFKATAAQTLVFVPGTVYCYDVLLFFNDGTNGRLELGTPPLGGISWVQQVTDATS